MVTLADTEASDDEGGDPDDEDAPERDYITYTAYRWAVVKMPRDGSHPLDLSAVLDQ
jgi:hypothetical protein